MRRSLALLVCCAVAAPLSSQTVDTTGAGALIGQAMDHSEVMANLEHLADVIGPRLTGSAAARRANDWTMQRFQAYGLKAHLEPWTFGVTWERGPVALRLTAPFDRIIVGHSWAWTAGTNGTVAGPVIRADISSPESLAVYLPKVKGAWILPNEPRPIFNPDGPPPTAEDSAAMREAFRARFRRPADTTEAGRKARQQFMIDLPYRLKQAGALGTLTDASKEYGLMNMSGSPYRVSPLPNIVIAHEDYAMLWRELEQGIAPRLEGSVRNRFGREAATQWNTVAEIPGTEHPGQVVILGGHLDSWDLGTGTTDNGTGSMAVLEAARIIAQSGLKPKRTIRFVLFTGEEQGLLGSKAYAAAHRGEADSIQAVLVLDNGTGRILGQALQGRADLEGLWKDLLVPVASLGADRVRDANKGGTDHLSFLPYGVPGFNFDQESRGYGHTHHSQIDTYEHAVGDDLKQASAVMAVTAFELANLPSMLPRGETSTVTPPEVAKPSAGLEKYEVTR